MSPRSDIEWPGSRPSTDGLGVRLSDHVGELERQVEVLSTCLQYIVRFPNGVGDHAPHRVAARALASYTAPAHFQCPACGQSFKVSSETSERIYCGPCARLAARSPSRTERKSDD